MKAEKIKQLIRTRISKEREEIERQKKLYGVASNYHNGKIKAFEEALELIGMFGKINNK